MVSVAQKSRAAGPAPGSAGVRGMISVVIPTYNRSRLIEETIASVAAQTWPSIEMLVVDDGSTDDTRERLERWRSAHPARPLRILRQHNRGPASARNRGASEAKGEFIYFIDSDDLIAPQALRLLVSGLASADVPFSVAHIRNTDLACRPVAGDGGGLSVVVENDYFACRWMTHAALYRRATLARAGPFDERLGRGEDTEHLWRVMATSGAGRLIPKMIGVRRIHAFGHLCVGRSPREAARDDLATVRQFAGWAERNDLFDRHIALGIFKRASIAAVRAGYGRDWACNRQALALLETVEQHGFAAAGTVRRLLGPRSRATYAALMLALTCMKWMRDRSRFGQAMRLPRGLPRTEPGTTRRRRLPGRPVPNMPPGTA
jgi:glycosyltransferase involved in cell wall biosynthesis